MKILSNTNDVYYRVEIELDGKWIPKTQYERLIDAIYAKNEMEATRSGLYRIVTCIDSQLRIETL